MLRLSTFVQIIVFLFVTNTSAQKSDHPSISSVTQLDEVSVQPDTVFFLKSDDFFERNRFTVTNNRSNIVNLDTLIVTENWWYEFFDTLGNFLDYPVPVPQGDSLTIVVQPMLLLTGGGFGGPFIIDTLSVVMDIGRDTVIIVVDPDFVGDVSVPLTEGTVSLFALRQNYPNPFNPSTTIEFELPFKGLVRLEIFDVLGKKHSTLVNEEKSPGDYRVRFSGQEFSSGVYFYTLSVRSNSKYFAQTKKMILLR